MDAAGALMLVPVLLVQVHDDLGLLVDDPGDTKRRTDLHQVGREALVQTAEALVLPRLARHVDNARVPRGVHRGALGLQPGAEDVERVDGRGAERAREAAHEAGHQRSRVEVLLVDAVALGAVPDISLLQEFEREHIKRRIGEHADETHGHATVGGGFAIGPHLAPGPRQ